MYADVVRCLRWPKFLVWDRSSGCLQILKNIKPFKFTISLILGVMQAYDFSEVFEKGPLGPRLCAIGLTDPVHFPPLSELSALSSPRGS